MTLKEQRLAAVKAAQLIISKATATGRPLTASEQADLTRKSQEVADLSAKIERADADAALFKGFERLGAPDERGEGRVGSWSVKGVADQLIHGPDGTETRGIKALVAAGSQVVPTADVGLIVPADRPVTALLDAVPAQEVPENFSYLRETVRTNNAAPVAAGALKPTSVFTLTRVVKRLKVVAHISEPIPEYWLADAPALGQFLEVEMLSGLAEAVVGQFLNGTSTGENLEGVTLASGVQTQAFTTDKIETARRGLGAVETLGMEGALYVFNPADWISIETTKATGSGEYLLERSGAPIDRVRRQLWGVPVALSTAVTAGTGFVFAQDAVRLFHDGEIQVKWGVISDDFAKNQIRCRVEGRFEAGALRPSGIVNLDLTA